MLKKQYSLRQTKYKTRKKWHNDFIKSRDKNIWLSGSINEKVEIPVGLSFPGELNGGHGGADRKMMMAFINCILNDTDPPIDVDMGISMSLPGIYADESSKKGGALVEIPSVKDI